VFNIGHNGDITGSGQDSSGSYTIVGKLHRDFSVYFQKTYDNVSDPKSVVKFQGKMDNCSLIQGNWTLEKNCSTGIFQLHINIDTWKGCYQVDGQQSSNFELKMKVYGDIEKGSIFGVGHENGADYVILGDVKNGTTVFKKYGANQNELGFTGKIYRDNSHNLKIVGNFNQTEYHGQFEIFENLATGYSPIFGTVNM
jgi:hypothetical protein